MCIKLVALRINLHTRVALDFKKVGDPCRRISSWNAVGT